MVQISNPMKQGNHAGRAGIAELWLAFPDDLLDPDAALSCIALLNAEEQARGERFRFNKRRREHLATHALKRIALSANSPRCPQSWQFQQNAHGKPAIHPESDLQFNLSNSDKLVACLVALNANVGVDVEAASRAPQILKLAHRVFSPIEQAQLRALDQTAQLDRALSLWTLKEAYIKARGKGLAIPLDRFSFLFGGPDRIHMELDPRLEDLADRWTFALFDHAEHRIALMIEGRPAAIKVHAASPILAPPTALNAESIVWYPQT